jgi:diguanylate cyclase (GGDEF)-like protein
MTIQLAPPAILTATIDTCALEPIHIPGAIQPHGALLVASARERRITHASANLEAIMGRSAAWALGRSLEDVLGGKTSAAIGCVGPRGGTALGEMTALVDGGLIDLQVHCDGDAICIDLQPAMAMSGRLSPMMMAQSLLDGFKHATSRSELCSLAVKGLHAITGFDRVMAYRFDRDGHGEIIAEAKIEALDSFLNQSYPAGDIPPQARALFLRKRVGAIADFDYEPVALLVAPALENPLPVDLTMSSLRSVSPVHCQYMRNMGVGASLTISLVDRDRLWGMVVCHHNSPRIASLEMRAVTDLIGQVMSLLLGSLGETEAYAERMTRQTAMQGLNDALVEDRPIAEVLLGAAPDLLALLSAGGVVLRHSGTMACFGQIPSLDIAAEAFDLLDSLAGGSPLDIDDLGLRFPALADCIALGSGALLLPLGLTKGDGILWFRPELPRNLVWGGDPAKHHDINSTTGQLSPRKSFAAWNETMRGRSAPWTQADLALAADLGTAIEAEVARRASAILARLRHYDPLTGLPNRRRLLDRLDEVAKQCIDGPPMAVMFLDLDRFKAINDTMGHAAGDTLLIEVARRLGETVGPGDLVARLGGDEFVLLCFGHDMPAIHVLSESIRHSIEQPFDLAGRPAHISVSIGIAFDDHIGSLDLIQAADIAMYEAKQNGGNRSARFEQALHDQAVHKFELDHDLREAVGNSDQFLLMFQPIFDIAAEAPVLRGFEALLRWQHPRLGWVVPSLFIPMAESSGLIIPLGDWVLVTALAQARLLRSVNAGLDLMMTINVSVLQLSQPGFCERLRNVLRDAGVPPSAICLEVTESMLSDGAIEAVLRDIRALGVKAAIDDFGTGYSSLSYLRRLPVDIVKLDISFLEDAGSNAGEDKFVSAIIGLVHAAGMEVIQEGVETAAQEATTRDSGADMVQGYLFGRPLLAEAAAALVRDQGPQIGRANRYRRPRRNQFVSGQHAATS